MRKIEPAYESGVWAPFGLEHTKSETVIGRVWGEAIDLYDIPVRMASRMPDRRSD